VRVARGSSSGGDAAAWLLLCTARTARPGGWPTFDVAALRAGLDGVPASTTVALVPAEVPATSVERLVAAGEAALACGPVASTLVPVVEAVKRVDGRRLVRTVDRTTLRHVLGPVVVRSELLRRVVDETDGPTVRAVHALVAAAGSVVDLEAAVGDDGDREEGHRG
jgi:hypothetical protein